MAQNDYDYSKTIGGFKGESIKSSMLGKNLKSRGLLSNNLPFRQSEGLAPYNPYSFLFPTGTEAGGVWRFTNSGDQYQTPTGASSTDPRINAIGQGIGIQLDHKINSVPHSIDLPTKPGAAINGSGVSLSNNAVTFLNVANGSDVTWANEFPVAERNRCEIQYKIEGDVGGTVLLYLGGGTNITIPASGVISGTLGINGAADGQLIIRSNTANLNAKITVLAITGYPGNHLVQATTTARPLTFAETLGLGAGPSVYSGKFDGIDDALVTATFAAGTYTNNMDFFCAVKRNNANQGIVIADAVAATHYFGSYNSSAGPSTTAVGAPTLYVDGVNVADDRILLNAALTPGNWHVLEYRNLNLSALTVFAVSLYNSFQTAANYGDVVLCPAQSNAIRAQTRTLVGAGVGVLL